MANCSVLGSFNKRVTVERGLGSFLESTAAPYVVSVCVSDSLRSQTAAPNITRASQTVPGMRRAT